MIYIIPCVFLLYSTYITCTKPVNKSCIEHLVDNSIMRYNRCKRVCSFSFIVSKVILKMYFEKYFKNTNDNNVKQLTKNLFEISYNINNNQYKMIVEYKRGPCPILQVIDDKMEDVTDLVLPYFGHKYDWNGFKDYSLEYFDVKSLTFEMADGTSKTCIEDKDLYSLFNSKETSKSISI